MTTKLIDQIRDDEILSLDQMVALYGRAWKEETRKAWETGRYSPCIEDKAALQRLRNRLGPSVLTALTQQKVHGTALDIARNWMAMNTASGGAS